MVELVGLMPQPQESCRPAATVCVRRQRGTVDCCSTHPRDVVRGERAGAGLALAREVDLAAVVVPAAGARQVQRCACRVGHQVLDDRRVVAVRFEDAAAGAGGDDDIVVEQCRTGADLEHDPRPVPVAVRHDDVARDAQVPPQVIEPHPRAVEVMDYEIVRHLPGETVYLQLREAKHR